LRLRNITKRFGATTAVDDVSLELHAGEIVAVVGENGAGKTTLMRIAAGELTADAGSIESAGRVGFVHQHFLLINDFTIAENLALDRAWRFATRARLLGEAEQVIAATGIVLRDPARRVEELSVGERSKLDLIKAIAKSPDVLILDEPTSVLAPAESDELFAVMRTLAANGTAVVFISHKLPEVLKIAQRVVVMRRGRVVAETREATAEELAREMIGPLAPPRGERGAGVRGTPGEILAIVGVAGNGQSQLAAKLRDEYPEAAHIPEDRTRDGIVAELSIAENLALKSKRWHRREANERARALIAEYSIRATGPSQKAASLSGGNQQKVILARELSPRPPMIVAAEPTRGLDLEATAFVHAKLSDAAAGGAKVILITSDLDEAFALADAIQVIYRGELSERMTPAEASGKVGAMMAGVA
jgi:simple sugar transport system ATP-binding protein